MPTGVIINALSVVFGGLLGGLVGNKLSEDFKTQINMIFGVCSMGMGISSIGLMKYMPAVIFAIVIGTGIGLALHLGDWINKGGALMQRSMAKIVPNDHSSLSHEDYLATLLTVIVLFCASGRCRDDWGFNNLDFKINFGLLHSSYFCLQSRLCGIACCYSTIYHFLLPLLLVSIHRATYNT